MRGVRVILWEAPPGGDPVQGLPAARPRACRRELAREWVNAIFSGIALDLVQANWAQACAGATGI